MIRCHLCVMFFMSSYLSISPSSHLPRKKSDGCRRPTRCPMAVGVPLYLSPTPYNSIQTSPNLLTTTTPPCCLTTTTPIRSRRPQPPPHPSSPTNSHTTTTMLLSLGSQPPYLIFFLGSHDNHHASFFSGDIEQ